MVTPIRTNSIPFSHRNTVTNEDRKAVEQMLRKATENLASLGHKSTIYPPQWMSRPTILERLPILISSLLSLLFLGLFTWASKSPNITKMAVSLLASVYPLLVIFVALCLCLHTPLEYVDRLNFRAVQFINVGAIANILFGNANLLSTNQASSAASLLGTFVGFSILSLGTVMFSYCTFTLGPWEFMVGSPLLAIGLLLRTCAAYVTLYEDTEDVGALLDIIACPVFVIALAFVIKKAYKLMRLPLLGSDNFRFFSVIFYGGSIVANSVLGILRYILEDTMSNGTYNFVTSIIAYLAFFGTSIFLLDGSRVKHHCNAQLEDRYPSTMYLVRSANGFMFANISCYVAFILTMAQTIMYLWEKAGMGNSPSHQILQFAASMIVTLNFFVQCICSMCPSLHKSIKNKEKHITRMILFVISGFILFGVGSFCSGIFNLIDEDDISSNNKGYGRRISHTIELVGASISSYSVWPKRDSLGVVNLFKPSTWENIYHPMNYVLLASVWLMIGAVCKIIFLYALGSLCYSWAIAVLLLHWNMSFYVWESMNLIAQTDTEADDDMDETDKDDLPPPEWMAEAKVDESYDVLISGGGISGLFLACILGKSGVKVILCEKRQQSITDARFAVLNSSSMEYFADILDPDILEELESRSLPPSTHFGSMLVTNLGISKGRIIAAANSPSRRVLMDNLEKMDDWTESRTVGSKYASQLPLRIMQSHQEAILKMQIARYPHVELHSGWSLQDFHIQQNSGVIARLVEVNEDEDGVQHLKTDIDAKYTIDAKYIIGCDGPNSIVAKKVGFKFDGLLNLAKTKSILVHIPGLYSRVVKTIGNTHQYQILKKDFGIAAVVAADPARDLWNVLFLFGKAKSASPEEVCRQFFNVDNFEIIQNRQWYWNFFIARTFRKRKRAFLVGDSAHSWPPFGALGGNSAYGDAVNLGWKLVMACKGKASDLLLESYAIERRQQILQTAMYVLRATPNPSLMKILTSRAFYNKLYMPIIKAGWYHHNSGMHSANHFAQSGIQLGVQLNFSPVIVREEIIPPDDPSCKYIPTFHSGARLPHLKFKSGIDIFSCLNRNGYTILVTKPEYADMAKSLNLSFKDRRASSHVSILPEFDPSSYEGHYRTIANLLQLEKVLIIRPDHIIAWRASSDDDSVYTLDFINNITSRLTGFGQNGECLRERYEKTNDADLTVAYHCWLTREFRYSQRPYKFRFPGAIPVHNLTKEKAIAMARAKKKNGTFTTTTKQGDEKNEGFKNGKTNIVIPDLTGFEKQVEAKPTTIYRIMEIARDREACGKPVYNFAVGNPSIEPPQEILDSFAKLTSAASVGTKKGLYKYLNPGGLHPLRSYIAKVIAKEQGIEEMPVDNVILTPGAQSALVTVFETLLQPGDNVLVETPFYPGFESAAVVWGGLTKNVAFVEDSLDMDLESLKELGNSAGSKLRVIVLCSPSNPSGKIMQQEMLEEICNIAHRHSQKYGRDVWILMDHTYSRVHFTTEPLPSIFRCYPQSIILSSFSKDVSLAGERLGYTAVNPSSKYSNKLSKWLSISNDKLGHISTPSLVQHVLVDVIEKHGKIPSLSDKYQERVNLMYDGLLTAGMKSCIKPDGAFYLFPRLPDGVDDRLFSAELVNTGGVLVIPGVEFGAPGYIRIAALPSCDEIMAACKIIEKCLSKLKDATNM